MANRSDRISWTARVICRSRMSGDAVTSTRTGAMWVALLRYVWRGTCIWAPTAAEEQWAWAPSSAACVVLSALVTVRDGASSVAENIVLRRRKKLVPVHASTGYVGYLASSWLEHDDGGVVVVVVVPVRAYAWWVCSSGTLYCKGYCKMTAQHNSPIRGFAIALPRSRRKSGRAHARMT